MFCPICKSEYRAGFTKCSDCGVDLVEHLPDDSNEANSDEMEILWAGQDAGVRDDVCEKLDAANISHDDDSVESRFMPAFRQSIYRIQVRRRDHDAALRAIGDLYTGDSNARPSPGVVLDRNSDWLGAGAVQRDIWGRLRGHNPSSLESGASSEDSASAFDSDSADASPDDISSDLEKFHPDDATSEVWSGEDRETAQNMIVCLREVGIGAAIEEGNGKFGVRVAPAVEARAREVVREIVDQAPPE